MASRSLKEVLAKGEPLATALDQIEALASTAEVFVMPIVVRRSLDSQGALLEVSYRVLGPDAGEIPALLEVLACVADLHPDLYAAAYHLIESLDTVRDQYH